MSGERDEMTTFEPEFGEIEGPSPRFVAELRGRLLAEAREMEARNTVYMAIAGQDDSPVGRIGRPQRAAPTDFGNPHPYRASSARGLFPAAFLVLAIVLAVAGFGGAGWGSGWFRDSTSTQPGAGSFIQAPATPQPVAMDGGNAAHTGVYPGAGPVGAATIAWRLTVPAASGPIVAGDRLFYLTATQGDQQLVCADLATGTTRWSVPVTLPVFYAVPTIANGLVYLPTPQGVVALDADTGTTVWNTELGTGGNSPSITVADGLAFVTAHDKTLRALDAATGRERWRATIPDSARPNSQPMDILASTFPVVVADGLAYTFGNGGLLLASDASDGQMKWSLETGSDLPPRAPMAADGTVVIATATGGQGGTVQTIDADSGSLRWQLPDDQVSKHIEIDPIAIDQGVLYLGRLGPDGKQLAAVPLDRGFPALWTYDTTAPAMGIGLANGVLYVVLEDGTVEGIDAATRTVVLSAYLGNAVDGRVGGGMLVVTTPDGLVAIEAAPATGTPAAAMTPANLSDLPACMQPREAPAELPAGTPAATLNVESKVVGPAVPGTVAQILTTNLPTGAPASAADIAGIQQTLNRLNDCVVGRADSPMVGGFFTDDFYRRGWGAGAGAGANNGDGPSWPIAAQASGPTIVQTIALDDGRIAVVVDFGRGPNFKLLVVFKQVSGAWLIDEWYMVVPEYKEPVG